jgi:hypothetical protein
MAAIVIRENAKATWLPGMARVLAKACDMVRRAVDYAASAVMICAVGTALLQLAVQIASFPAPVAVTAFTLIAVTVFQSLRRHRRARARHRHGPGTPRSASDKPPGSDRVPSRAGLTGTTGRPRSKPARDASAAVQ